MLFGHFKTRPVGTRRRTGSGVLHQKILAGKMSGAVPSAFNGKFPLPVPTETRGNAGDADGCLRTNAVAPPHTAGAPFRDPARGAATFQTPNPRPTERPTGAGGGEHHFPSHPLPPLKFLGVIRLRKPPFRQAQVLLDAGQKIWRQWRRMADKLEQRASRETKCGREEESGTRSMMFFM